MIYPITSAVLDNPASLQSPFALNLKIVETNNKLVSAELREIVSKYLEVRRDVDNVFTTEIITERGRVYQVCAMILLEDGFHPCDTVQNCEYVKHLDETKNLVDIKVPLDSFNSQKSKFWFKIVHKDNEETIQTAKITLKTITKLQTSCISLKDEIFQKYMNIAGFNLAPLK